MVETDLRTAREQESHLRQEAAEARAKLQAEAATTHEEAARIATETLIQEQLEHDTAAAQFRAEQYYTIRLEREAEEGRAKAQAEATAHEEAARAIAEKLMQEHAIAQIRREREAEEAAAREEAARAVAEKLVQEQGVRDTIAAQFQTQELEDRIRREREAEESRAKAQAEAAAHEEAAHAVVEKLMQEQRERDAIAAREDRIRQESEAEARAKGPIGQEKENVAKAGAQGDMDVAQEGARDGIAGPTTKSLKPKKSNKRPRVVNSSESDDGEGEEGDGESLSEAELRKRERE